MPKVPFIRQCADCKKLIARNPSDRTRKTKSGPAAIYIDATGRQWSGRKCPDCVYAGNKKRKERRDQDDADLRIDPLTERRCRKCKERLPQSRYFAHVKCAPGAQCLDLTEFYSLEV